MTLAHCLSLLEEKRYLVIKEGDYAWSINAFRSGFSYEDLNTPATCVWRSNPEHWRTWNQVVGELVLAGGTRYPILYQPNRNA